MSATVFVADHEVLAMLQLVRTARETVNSVFADVDRHRLSICADAVEGLLDRIAAINDDGEQENEQSPIDDDDNDE